MITEISYEHIVLEAENWDADGILIVVIFHQFLNRRCREPSGRRNSYFDFGLVEQIAAELKHPQIRRRTRSLCHSTAVIESLLYPCLTEFGVPKSDQNGMVADVAQLWIKKSGFCFPLLVVAYHEEEIYELGETVPPRPRTRVFDSTYYQSLLHEEWYLSRYNLGGRFSIDEDGDEDEDAKKSAAGAIMERLPILYMMCSCEVCAICLENFEESKARVLKCGHLYHEGCLFSWLRSCESYECPLCRSSIPYWF